MCDLDFLLPGQYFFFVPGHSHSLLGKSVQALEWSFFIGGEQAANVTESE